MSIKEILPTMWKGQCNSEFETCLPQPKNVGAYASSFIQAYLLVSVQQTLLTKFLIMRMIPILHLATRISLFAIHLKSFPSCADSVFYPSVYSVKVIQLTDSVYFIRECLKLIPHQKFSFAKIWLLAAQFEIRQLRIKEARLLLGEAIGRAPKDKVILRHLYVC